MEFALFDVIGIAIYLLIAAIIYKKGWFFSFYSFFKFILIFILSLTIGLIISAHNPVNLPVTRLQQSLIIQGILFLALWRLISFRKAFFFVTGGKIGLSRFMFIHHIDKVLSIFPSLVASFFISFFLFTILISSSTTNPSLQRKIEDSKIVRPISYEVYFATFNEKHLGLFQNVAYKLIPVFDPLAHTNLPVPDIQTVNIFKEKVDQQREDAGLAPVGGMGVFVPPAPAQTAPEPSDAPPSHIISPTVHMLPRAPIFEETPVSLPPEVLIPTGFPTSIPPTATPFQQQEVPIPTPQPPSPPSVNISQIEQDIFRLTNEQRQQNGLPPFALDNNIAAVARTHSQDMANRNFFDHVNPDGLTPPQRLQIGGVSFSLQGENIAGGPTADFMVTQWMGSAGHRAAILSPTYGRIGIGVALSPTYGLVATQNFAN